MSPRDLRIIPISLAILICIKNIRPASSSIHVVKCLLLSKTYYNSRLLSSFCGRVWMFQRFKSAFRITCSFRSEFKFIKVVEHFLTLPSKFAVHYMHNFFTRSYPIIKNHKIKSKIFRSIFFHIQIKLHYCIHALSNRCCTTHSSFPNRYLTIFSFRGNERLKFEIIIYFFVIILYCVRKEEALR